MLFVSPSVQFSRIQKKQYFRIQNIDSYPQTQLFHHKKYSKMLFVSTSIQFSRIRKNHISVFKTLIPTRKTTFSSQKNTRKCCSFQSEKTLKIESQILRPPELRISGYRTLVQMTEFSRWLHYFRE